MRRTSNTRSNGCFVKKFYDLPEANLSHTEECQKTGILHLNFGARTLSASAINIAG